MRLYHGSTMAVRKSSLRPGRTNADFGKGFYTTSNPEQAERWAHIKQEREDASRAIFCNRLPAVPSPSVRFGARTFCQRQGFHDRQPV